MPNRPYNPADYKSIEAYACKLVDKTFLDVIVEHTSNSEREKAILAYGKVDLLEGRKKGSACCG